MREGPPPVGALPVPIRTTGGRLRPIVRTIQEALRLIESELPIELRRLPRWTFARELLHVAARSGKKTDLNTAVRQFKQALCNEGCLGD